MAQHTLTIRQVLRVEKSTTIRVEAPTRDLAIAMIQEGEIDVPSASDDLAGVWTLEHSSVMNEEVS